MPRRVFDDYDFYGDAPPDEFGAADEFYFDDLPPEDLPAQDSHTLDIADPDPDAAAPKPASAAREAPISTPAPERDEAASASLGVVYPLVIDLRSRDWPRRAAAARTLMSLGLAAVEGLVELMPGEEKPIRDPMIMAIVAAGPEALPALLRLIDHKDADLRERACWALGQLGDPRALTPLRAATHDRSKAVARAAREALDLLENPAEAPDPDRFKGTNDRFA